VSVIAHISDLHFGQEDPFAADRLLEDLNEISPHVVVVSGDLTQRARRKEFRAARDYLERIPFPKIIVPGNHDIPLYNLYDRFVKKLTSFQKYVSPLLNEVFENDQLAIYGINTARAWSFKEGRISREQIEWLRQGLAETGRNKFKILVTHHPLPDLGRSGLAIPILDQGGVDLVLTGHVHESSLGDLKADLLLTTRSMLAIGAGTAISARTRGEPNSYNVIKIDGESLTLCLKVLAQNSFVQVDEFRFLRTEHRWVRQ
jgi:3',5'-cyclic AMP phosphodiesterase CpdA